METVIEAAAPERALTEVWRVAMSLKKELRMQIHMRKTREGERSVLSESTQIEKAIERANYLRSMFETLTEKNTSTSSNWRDVLERLRSSKKSTSTTKSLSSETRRILRAVKDFVVAETPTLESVDRVRKIQLERCLRRRDALHLTLATIRIACPTMEEENEILACRAVSVLEPVLWQLQSALCMLKDDPNVLSGLQCVAFNIKSEILTVWKSVQESVSKYLLVLPLPLPPPRTPLTPRRMSRDNKTPSPIVPPLLLGDAVSESNSSSNTSRTTTITFGSRRGGRVSPRT